MDETTLSNEEEGFTLDPIDASGQTYSCFYFYVWYTTLLFTMRYLNNLWHIIRGSQCSNDVCNTIGKECKGNLRWSFHIFNPGQAIYPAWETGQFKIEFNSSSYWAITLHWAQK